MLRRKQLKIYWQSKWNFGGGRQENEGKIKFQIKETGEQWSYKFLL
jgi:hypothetical protein